MLVLGMMKGLLAATKKSSLKDLRGLGAEEPSPSAN